jgi:hypothetical protein
MGKGVGKNATDAGCEIVKASILSQIVKDDTCVSERGQGGGHSANNASFPYRYDTGHGMIKSRDLSDGDLDPSEY